MSPGHRRATLRASDTNTATGQLAAHFFGGVQPMGTYTAHGPYLLGTVGDRILGPMRMMAVIWEGASTAGDVVELRDPVNGNLIWSGRATGIQTYQGANFGDKSVACPNGIVLSIRSSGRVLVYPDED